MDKERLVGDKFEIERFQNGPNVIYCIHEYEADEEYGYRPVLNNTTIVLHPEERGVSMYEFQGGFYQEDYQVEHSITCKKGNTFPTMEMAEKKIKGICVAKKL